MLWGYSLFFNESVIEGFDPFTTMFGRVAIAGAVLWLSLHARGLALAESPADWRDFLIMRTLNNFIPFTLIVWGQ